MNGVGHQEQIVSPAFGLHDDFLGFVPGSAVGVHDHRSLGGEVLCQSHRDGANYMPDGARVVVAGYANNDVGLPNMIQTRLQLSWKEFIHDCARLPCAR
jgi:hypothetical protein